MASSPSTGSNSPKDAFPDFVEIGPATYYYDPTTTTTTKSSATSNGSTKSPSLKSSLPQPSSSPHPPQLILLATWLSAAPAHITKYLTGYRALYPGVPILLIRSAPPDIVPFNLTDLDKQFAPAVAAIKAACPTPTPFPSPSTPAPSFSNGTANKDRKPQILFHGFSNGGPNQALKLFRAYSKASNNNGAPLPKHVTIFDSCPGHSGLSLLLAALWLSVPKKGSVPLVARWAIILLFHVVAVGYAVAMRVFGAPDPIERVKAAFLDNDPATPTTPATGKGEMRTEMRRVYIYSEEDVMVPHEAVEEHARKAAENGFEVRREKFVGSGHCAHVRADPARYWGVVRGVWEGGEGREGRDG